MNKRIEYHTIEIRSEADLNQAEALQAAGWIVESIDLSSIQFSREIA